MTQDECLEQKYQEVIEFIENNHRNASRHILEEHDLLNWMKATRKRMNAGELAEPRLEMFKELLEFSEKYRRKNQYD